MWAINFALNWLIKTLLILFFCYVGWMHVRPNSEHLNGSQTFWAAGVLSLIFVIVLTGVATVARYAGILTCGIAILALPLVGFFTLKIIDATTSDIFTMTHNVWLQVLMGLVLSASFGSYSSSSHTRNYDLD